MSTHTSIHLGDGRLDKVAASLHSYGQGGCVGVAIPGGGRLMIHSDDLDALAVSLQSMADAAAEAAGWARSERAGVAS